MTDDRDLRDPALDALLRTHSAETPPQAVDAAILAAAHRAVEAAPRARPARATQPWRWWMPLAAAAVIGVVAVGIFPLAPTLVEPTAPTVSDAPTNTVTAPSSSAARLDAPRERAANPEKATTTDGSVAAKAERDKVTATASRDQRERSRFDFYKVLPGSSTPQPSAKAPSVAAPEPSAKQVDGAKAQRPETQSGGGAPPSSTTSQELASHARTIARQNASPPGSPMAQQNAGAPSPLMTRRPSTASDSAAMQQNAAASPPPAASAPAVVARPDAGMADRSEPQAARPQSVEEWIAQIRTLRDEARTAEAIRALAGFRAAFSDADARLPEDLRAWAKTVR